MQLAGNFFPVEQAPEEPAKGFYKDEVDRAPSTSPIEKIPLDQTRDPIRSRPKNLVLILREDKVGDLANSLQTFAPRGSHVTVISKEKPEVQAWFKHVASTGWSSHCKGALCYLRLLISEKLGQPSPT